MRRGPSSCMGNCHVKRGGRKVVYEDMNNLYGWRSSQYLPTGDFRELNLSNRISLIKSFLRTLNNDEHGFSVEGNSEYESSIQEETKRFPFLPKKAIKKEDFSPYKMKNKSENYKRTEKLIMDKTENRDFFYNVDI